MTDKNTAGIDLDKPENALAAITNRLALAYNLCCGLAPKQAVGELLEVTINMPEWETVHAALARRAEPSVTADERVLFEQQANDARFFPREIDFSRTKSPGGRDEYANSHLQSRWEGWQARAALASPAVTEGYKLVPIEPTPAQQQAGHDTPGAHGYNASYRAMVKAAPAVSQSAALEAPALRPLSAGLPLPEDHDRVLVYTEGVDFNGDQYFDINTEDLWEPDPDMRTEVADAATHWMPLPRPGAAPEVPTNEVLEELWTTTHYGHPADFAADVLQRWGGWQPGLLGYGGALNAKANAPAVSQMDGAAVECGKCNDSGIVGFPPDQYESCPACTPAATTASAIECTTCNGNREREISEFKTVPCPDCATAPSQDADKCDGCEGDCDSCPLDEKRAALARAPLPGQGDWRKTMRDLVRVLRGVECGDDGQWKFIANVCSNAEELLAAPAQAGDALDERDMMLWLSDDPEVFANGPDDFANDYAANCLSVGDDVEVDVDCTYRAPKRALRIALIPKGDDDDCEVVWKWVERAAMSASQGTTREAE